MAIIDKRQDMSATIREYYGLSTDTKPTENVGIGSTFFEINTSKVYMYNGTAWVEL